VASPTRHTNAIRTLAVRIARKIYPGNKKPGL